MHHHTQAKLCFESEVRFFFLVGVVIEHFCVLNMVPIVNYERNS